MQKDNDVLRRVLVLLQSRHAFLSLGRTDCTRKGLFILLLIIPRELELVTVPPSPSLGFFFVAEMIRAEEKD